MLFVAGTHFVSDSQHTRSYHFPDGIKEEERKKKKERSTALLVLPLPLMASFKRGSEAADILEVASRTM